jgi:hypothetical protein
MIGFIGIGIPEIVIGVLVLGALFVLIYWLSGKSDDDSK